MSVTLADIEEAHRAISPAIIDTPYLKSRTLSQITGAEIWIKFENLQFTASFKERGALNKLLSLSDAEKARGVIAMSAGNHAQGVAYHASRLGIPATIVMPAGTPFIKVKHTQAHGANVVLSGQSLAEARAVADERAAEQGLVFVHPYDDPEIIAGQGTVGLEMADKGPALDTIIVPIGGGGLISGVATAFKARHPQTQVIGVEAELFAAMKQMRDGLPVVTGGATIAEGIAVGEIGRLTFEICERLVDDIVLVSETALEQAVYLFLTVEKTVAEGAGAASLAALIADPDRFRGQRVGLVLCGGNIDSRLLASVVMRELMREGRICQVEVDVEDLPGQLSHVTGLVGEKGASILEVQHSRMSLDLSAKQTRLELMFEARDKGHIDEVLSALQSAGMEVRRLN